MLGITSTMYVAESVMCDVVGNNVGLFVYLVGILVGITLEQ